MQISIIGGSDAGISAALRAREVNLIAERGAEKRYAAARSIDRELRKARAAAESEDADIRLVIHAADGGFSDAVPLPPVGA